MTSNYVSGVEKVPTIILKESVRHNHAKNILSPQLSKDSFKMIVGTFSTPLT